MRKLFLLLTITFLFQSCFSYRHQANPGSMVIGEKYKIERNHKTRKFFYARTTDSALVVSKPRYGKEQQIPLNEITGIRKRKFSIIKTIALVPAAAASLVVLVLIANPSPVSGMGEIQWPD
jgi:hypothetical protein